MYFLSCVFQESYIVQWESRCVRPVVDEPLDPRLFFILLILFVIRTTGQDVVHLTEGSYRCNGGLQDKLCNHYLTL